MASRKLINFVCIRNYRTLSPCVYSPLILNIAFWNPISFTCNWISSNYRTFYITVTLLFVLSCNRHQRLSSPPPGSPSTAIRWNRKGTKEGRRRANPESHFNAALGAALRRRPQNKECKQRHSAGAGAYGRPHFPRPGAALLRRPHKAISSLAGVALRLTQNSLPSARSPVAGLRPRAAFEV